MVSFQKVFFSIVAFRQLTAKPLLTQLIKSVRSLLRQLIKVVFFLFPKKLILGESLPYTRLKLVITNTQLKVKAPTNSLIRKLVK